jgi:hypothetical protein
MEIFQALNAMLGLNKLTYSLLVTDDVLLFTNLADNEQPLARNQTRQSKLCFHASKA